MNDEMNTGEKPPARPWFWAALFALGMAAVAAARIAGLIEGPAAVLLQLLPMVLLVPLVRASLRRQADAGAMSPALRRYNRRVLTAGGLYMIAMILAGNLYHHVEQGSPVMWALALVPLLPVLGMLWAMIRYLPEETDEYLRHRAINAALIGLVLVLGLGTAWGFLEMFGLVPHVWNWWVFPVWAIGLGIGQCRGAWKQR